MIPRIAENNIIMALAFSLPRFLAFCAVMLTLCVSHESVAFPVTALQAAIELAEPQPGRAWTGTSFGNDVVVLVTGQDLFKKNESGEAEQLVFKLKITPRNGFTLTEPVSCAPGENVLIDAHFVPGQSKILWPGASGEPNDHLKFMKDEIPVRIYVHLIPALLHEVEFVNTAEDLHSDDGSVVYNAPHWKDGNHDLVVDPGYSEHSPDRNYPVAFVRNTKPRIKVGVRLGARLPELPALPHRLRLKLSAVSQNANGMQIDEEVLVEDEQHSLRAVFLMDSIVSEVPLDDVIDYFDSGEEQVPALHVKWTIGLEYTDGMIDLQDTRHTLYQLAAPPLTGEFGPRESMFYFACKGAAAADPNSPMEITDQLFTTIFQVILSTTPGGEPHFERKDIRRVKPGRAVPDPNAIRMKYYTGDQEPGDDYIPRKGLGQCAGWSRLMRDVVRVHGVTNIRRMEIYTDTDAYVDGANVRTFYVRIRDQFEDVPNANLPALILLDIGQGPEDRTPPEEWGHHVIVKFGAGQEADVRYYDPSYGSGPYMSLADYEKNGTPGFRGVMNDGGSHPYSVYWADRENVSELKAEQF